MTFATIVGSFNHRLSVPSGTVDQRTDESYSCFIHTTDLVQMTSLLHVDDHICLYPRDLRLVPRCSEWPTLERAKLIHLRLEFVAFAPTCLGRRDLQLDFLNRVTGMKQVGQTNRRIFHNFRNLQIVQLLQ